MRQDSDMHCDAMQFDVAGLLNVLNVFVCVLY
jgi:hypothetical protein